MQQSHALLAIAKLLVLTTYGASPSLYNNNINDNNNIKPISVNVIRVRLGCTCCGSCQKLAWVTLNRFLRVGKISAGWYVYVKAAGTIHWGNTQQDVELCKVLLGIWSSLVSTSLVFCVSISWWTDRPYMIRHPSTALLPIIEGRCTIYNIAS